MLEHTIPKLSEAACELIVFPETKRFECIRVSVIAVGDGAVVLSAKIRRDQTKWFFSVAMDTKKLQLLSKGSYRRMVRTFAYALPWPRQFYR